MPGTWTLDVAFAEPVVGNELSQPYIGSVQFNTVKVTARGIPDQPQQKLVAGQPVTVPVRITNTGAATQDFFVDPRLNSNESVALAPFSDNTITLPNTGLRRLRRLEPTPRP